MNWCVTVKTETGYIKQVKVYDYNFESDAVNAALSQTGATQYLTAIPFYENSQTTNSSVTYSSPSNSSTSYTRGRDPDFDMFEATTFLVGAILIPVGALAPGLWFGGFLVMGIALIHYAIRKVKENL